MKRFFYIALAVIGITSVLSVVGPHSTVFAATAKSAVCGGVGASAGSANCTTSGPSVNDLIATIINILSIIAGIAAVIMVIVAGLRYITAGGESSKISGAKSALTYALVGVVIAASAKAIVQFVLNKSGV